MRRLRTKKKSCLMIKEWSLALLGLSTLVLAVILPQAASAVSLKSSSSVDGQAITLGDIFTGLDKDADKVLGAAPQPGSDMVLDSYTLMRIAIALDLPWRPASSADKLVIKRAATVIDVSMIEEAIKNEITTQNAGAKYNVMFSSEIQKIILPKDQPQSVEILSMDFQPEKNRFEAVIVAPSKDKPLQQINVSGTLDRLVSIPVLMNSTQNGTLISNADLEFIDMREASLTADIIMKPEDLIGMTPRRTVNAQKPIKKNDLIAPQIVGRGQSVTMVLNSGGLSLTALGKAMQGGAKGDSIRVVNASSNKTIEAIITGDKEVTVQSF